MLKRSKKRSVCIVKNMLFILSFFYFLPLTFICSFYGWMFFRHKSHFYCISRLWNYVQPLTFQYGTPMSVLSGTQHQLTHSPVKTSTFPLGYMYVSQGVTLGIILPIISFYGNHSQRYFLWSHYSLNTHFLLYYL